MLRCHCSALSWTHFFRWTYIWIRIEREKNEKEKSTYETANSFPNYSDFFSLICHLPFAISSVLIFFLHRYMCFFGITSHTILRIKFVFIMIIITNFYFIYLFSVRFFHLLLLKHYLIVPILLNICYKVRFLCILCMPKLLYCRVSHDI